MLTENIVYLMDHIVQFIFTPAPHPILFNFGDIDIGLQGIIVLEDVFVVAYHGNSFVSKAHIGLNSGM